MRVGSKMVSVLKIQLKTAGFFILVSFFSLPAMALDGFMVHGDGTVTDNKTGLMWAAMDNGIPINWMDAQRYCRKYTGGGYTDWRMPALAELASLYDPGEKNKRGYHVTQSINTTASSCWASETRANKAARFNFTYGSVYWFRPAYSGPTRVLPVRNGK